MGAYTLSENENKRNLYFFIQYIHTHYFLNNVFFLFLVFKTVKSPDSAEAFFPHDYFK
jgi:hypothetical protein